MKAIAPEEILFEAEVLSVEDSSEGRIGVVQFHGVKIRVYLSLLPEVGQGDVVLIQGRFALSRREDEHEVC
ncbi:MAG TPA: HypC/HybG/HupF family hydrogenase formation chaperone [Acidobacteriota bacterium]|nr:HypC/HybG/HupF family hydrogenase formation chaperone [Acidobacteriota bacterium]